MSKRSKPSSHKTDAEPDFHNLPPISERSKASPKKSSPKPPPTQTDREGDDLVTKITKTPWKFDKGKARATNSPPENFESAGTDFGLEDHRPGPSTVNILSVEERALSDACETATTSIILRSASDRSDVSEEERQQRPPPKKRSHPRNDKEGEEPLPKRGRVRKSNGSGQGKHLPGTKLKRQLKKLSPKPRSTGTNGMSRKRVDPLPETSDVERDDVVFRKPDQVSNDEKRSGSCPDRTCSNPNHLRLDSIPPEGIVIRKKNGIVERLLPPVTYA